MNTIILFLLSILAAPYVCNAYKILVVFPLPSKSHSFLGNGVVRHLLNAGHEVTYITPYVKKDAHPKLHQISTSSLEKIIKEMEDQMKIENIMNDKMQLNIPELVFFIMNKFSTLTLENENVQSLLQDKSQHFDLVIAEWMFCELYVGFHAVFNAPLMWLFSTEPETTVLSTIDEYLNPSYNGFFSADSPPFSFWQRLSSLWTLTRAIILKETILNYMQHQTYKQYIVPHIESRGRIAPSYSELRYNASMILGNSYFATGEAVRLPQNYKHIGGFHIDEKPQPLTEELKMLMDNSTNGVIYFSMGSNLKSKDFPDNLKKSLVNMFGTLKQTVLWKFEEELPNKPKNLHILKWAPQQSILAHPNCVLFITHGGMLSTIETVNAGKRNIGIPVAADQFTNVMRAVNKGYAKRVDLSYTMADELKVAIEEVLTDPRYAQKAKELSFIFHDRLVKPGDELVHWAEHVIKTGGAPHLRSPALLVPWYEKYYLDVLVLFILISLIQIKIFAFVKPFLMLCIRKIRNYVFFNSRNSNKNKTN